MYTDIKIKQDNKACKDVLIMQICGHSLPDTQKLHSNNHNSRHLDYTVKHKNDQMQ